MVLRVTGDVKGAIQEKSHIAMKDIKWSTLNCTVGYLIAGKLRVEVQFYETIFVSVFIYVFRIQI